MKNSLITPGQERRILDLLRDQLRKLEIDSESAQLLISRGGDFQAHSRAVIQEIAELKRYSFPRYRKRIHFGGSFCPEAGDDGYWYGKYMTIADGFCFHSGNRFMGEKYELPSPENEEEFLISLWCELAKKARIKVGDIVVREELKLRFEDIGKDGPITAGITWYKVLAIEQNASRKKLAADLKEDESNAYLRFATTEEYSSLL